MIFGHDQWYQVHSVSTYCMDLPIVSCLHTSIEDKLLVKLQVPERAAMVRRGNRPHPENKSDGFLLGFNFSHALVHRASLSCKYWWKISNSKQKAKWLEPISFFSMIRCSACSSQTGSEGLQNLSGFVGGPDGHRQCLRPFHVVCQDRDTVRKFCPLPLEKERIRMLCRYLDDMHL